MDHIGLLDIYWNKSRRRLENLFYYPLYLLPEKRTPIDLK